MINPNGFAFATLTVGPYPNGVGVNSAGNRLYVVNSDNTVWWFAL